tara:strand:+ start:889 stop:1227 length:339 start_codon:yes stop_codon:yes gene_type:complete
MNHHPGNKIEKCPSGHRLTAENTYWQKKHANTYKVCRACKRIAAKDRKSNGYTKADQKQLSQMEIVTEDISGITNCPKCDGILKWGDDTRYDDLVACIACGWRPSAAVVMEL